MSRFDGLSGLAPEGWFSDRATSSFWLRIYLCVLIPRDEFLGAVNAMFAQLHEHRFSLEPTKPLRVAAGTVQGLQLPGQTLSLGAAPSGELNVFVRVDSKPLADSQYVFAATPFVIDGSPGNEGSARETLSELAALMCLHFGQNFMREVVFEGEVHAVEQKVTVPGAAIRMPQPAEGPFLRIQNGSDAAEIADAIRQLPDGEKRRRTLLALRLVDEAMRRDDGFLNYWTALEVICGGGANRMKAALAEIYQIKNQNVVAEATKLSVFARWRHDYVHRGVRPILNADVGRYLELLFLDLLRRELGLPSRRYVAAIQAAKGYDLSSIGLEEHPDPDSQESHE